MLPEFIPLWAHQREAVAESLKHRDFAYLMEMGTGKTAAVINTLRHRYTDARRVMRTLVLCPIAVAINWQREFTAHASPGVAKAVVVLTGPGKTRVERMRGLVSAYNLAPTSAYAGAIVVTNYEALQMKELLALFHEYRFEILVCDESQRLKNHSSKRTKETIKLADKAKHRYLMTGTPILNSALDIFGQWRTLDGGQTFGQNYFVFRSTFFDDRNKNMPSQKHFPDWQPKPGALDEISRKLHQKSHRALKKDCLDLPPFVRERHYVELTPRQRRMHDEMAGHLVTFLDTADPKSAATAQIALTKVLRMMQIATGFVTLESGEVERIEDDVDPRLDALMDLLADLTPTSKVIVWACFKENYGAVTQRLDEAGIGYVQLVGGMSDKQRQGAIDEFNSQESARVFLSNQLAGGVGINLACSNYSVYFSRNFSLEADMQSEARNYRGGSEVHDKVTRIDIVAPNSVDDYVLERLAAKQNLAEHLLDFKEFLRSVTPFNRRRNARVHLPHAQDANGNP